MFTEGLDSNALKWVREKELPYSNSSLRPRMDPITNTRSGGRNFGLPPPAKFRSGHLPATAIPVTSTTLTGDVEDDSASASENDVTTDSDEDTVYGGRYSLDSSPQDERIPDGTARRYGNPAQRKPRYATASDYTYSDVSSSMETLMGGRGGNLGDRLARGNGRYPVGRDGFTEEDESSDSAGSSEFSTTQVGSINGRIPRNRAYASEGYASSVPSRINAVNAAEKDLNSRKLQHEKFSDDDIPSAPPFSSSVQEVKQDIEHIPTSEIQSTWCAADSHDPKTFKSMSGVKPEHNMGNKKSDEFVRSGAGAEAATASSCVHPARIPTFHASALGPWHAVIAYDACVRLCLHAWARGCMEAPMFLENECALLRDTFGIQQVLLQSEEELMAKRSSELTTEVAPPKPKKIVGKMKVQVRKVKTTLDPPTGCSMSSLSLRAPVIKLETIRYHFSNFQSTLSSRWQAFRKIRVAPRLPANGSFSRQSLAYVHAGTHYIKQVSGLLKIGVTSLRNSSSSYEVGQETYSCMLRLKSSTEEDGIRLQPGSGETHVFFPDSLGDDLIVEVQDSKGKHFGRVLAQVATIAEDSTDKLRWWSIYCEPEHEPVGKLQLYINYSTSSDDNSHLKYGSVAETVAYDLVLEVAMKVQHFQQRNLQLHGSWKWLLTEFASYYGVSDVYTKLRYLSYVMDVATPTADCLTLVHELLMPVVMKGHSKSTLSHQENRILGETKDQIEQILSLVFENYKSLDESSLSGIMDVFKPATGLAAPALEPAVELYTLLHDILSPEAQTNLCHYFQAAARKRSRRHLAETDEFVTTNNEPSFMDPVAMSTAYQKMTCLCMNIKNEISTDIEIHNQNILPSFIDLPNLSASIYSSELCSRLRAFLLACPPSGPSPPVAELVIATADFQRDLVSWNISHVKGGVDAKELFHLYIMIWIQDKRQSLLESCKLDKVKWSGVRTQHSTTPFVDEMYDRLRETLSDYEVIICRWPEYIFVLENTKLQNSTKLKKILQDSKETVGESDIRGRMQPLKEQLTSSINHLHTVFETHVFIAICRWYWDRMGQDVLSFLENRKENRSWYKGSRIAVSILDDTFASQMQQLVGNALPEKDLEPPRSITEVRSMLCKDAHNHEDNSYYY
ncbi:uncharacterized protein LOC111312441 isoform X3 [Durio zibethinus]|uniref:Uncharacterized protein LOC111312441 isoform X3 n=1 Tax=Durio zibethinus TaxID=66656 RepID=A0A6P6AU52_DURZI|nr:uncharacterized protein LOC111312441 isoform X3 [Durio zibethinus]